MTIGYILWYNKLDGSNILSETTNGNTIRYYYGVSGIVGFRYNGSRYYYEKNLQGDIIAIYSEDGTRICEYIYDAWGNCTIRNDITDAGIGGVNPFRYRGYYYDSETGLYYLKSRYYDPAVGRFINADEISYLGANGDFGAYNLYAYCGNNPVIMIDQSGNFLQFIEDIIRLSKNDDGSHSLYDNDRFRNDNTWHEQIFVITPSSPVYEVDGHYNIDAWSFGFGISADLFTGGWETEYTDLSLFDFGHSEANFEISNDGFNIGAMASIWNPSLEFSVWGVTLEIGAAVGSVGIGGKKEANSIEYKIGLGTGGFFKISW